MKYYTADTHFGDERIIRLCNRPFDTLQDMTSNIIKRWNSTVDVNDDVYIIGDYACGNLDAFNEITNSLNGIKHLVPGNHDVEWMSDPAKSAMFDIMSMIDVITDNERKVVLCHYPLAAYDGSTSGAVHVYGHVHNNYNEPNYELIGSLKGCYNAGVDVNDFTPKTLEQLMGATI